MDADTDVGASCPILLPNETGLPLQVPFSVTSVLIVLLGTGSVACRSLKCCISLQMIDIGVNGIPYDFTVSLRDNRQTFRDLPTA